MASSMKRKLWSEESMAAAVHSKNKGLRGCSTLSKHSADIPMEVLMREVGQDPVQCSLMKRKTSYLSYSDGRYGLRS